MSKQAKSADVIVIPMIIDGQEMPIWEVDCQICGKRLTQREYYRVPRGYWEAMHIACANCVRKYSTDGGDHRRHCPHCGGHID
jgi:hypothetical protein